MNQDTFKSYKSEELIQMFLQHGHSFKDVTSFLDKSTGRMVRGERPLHIDMGNGIGLDIRFHFHKNDHDPVIKSWYRVTVRYSKDNTWLYERHVADIDEHGVVYFDTPDHLYSIETTNSYSYGVERMVNAILEDYERSIVEHFGKSITIVSVKMPNGFVLTESSTCVDPSSFDIEIGTRACLGRLKPRVWMLIAYNRMTEVENGNCKH